MCNITGHNGHTSWVNDEHAQHGLCWTISMNYTIHHYANNPTKVVRVVFVMLACQNQLAEPQRKSNDTTTSPLKHKQLQYMSQTLNMILIHHICINITTSPSDMCGCLPLNLISNDMNANVIINSGDILNSGPERLLDRLWSFQRSHGWIQFVTTTH